MCLGAPASSTTLPHHRLRVRCVTPHQTWDKLRAAQLKQAEAKAKAQARREAKLAGQQPKYRKLRRSIDRRPAAVRWQLASRTRAHTHTHTHTHTDTTRH